MKKEKKTRSKARKIVMGIFIALLVVVLGMGTMAGVYLGVFHAGNSGKYAVRTVTTDPNSPLSGKTIVFLGSSVTMGMGSLGSSFVDYIAAMDGANCIEEAVSGTTLTDTGETSYVQRMLNNLDPNMDVDAFVCQLSTNDATKGLPLGKVSEGTSLGDFDTATIIGAMEYIICYAQQTWNCHVIFYTGTHYNDAAYDAMVKALLELRVKWGIGVIDLWNDTALNNITDEQRALYMKDDIHPTRAGYLLWWTPAIRAYLHKALA